MKKPNAVKAIQDRLESYRAALERRTGICCNRHCDGCRPVRIRYSKTEDGIPDSKFSEVLLADRQAKEAKRKALIRLAEAEQVNEEKCDTDGGQRQN
ncbi:MAG: hypothetical protein OXU45_05715 [Candidatus Melainabacteria bacterium]|nr:hypothetical protein [Candidatus Melainabacteria bacterium]